MLTGSCWLDPATWILLTDPATCALMPKSCCLGPAVWVLLLGSCLLPRSCGLGPAAWVLHLDPADWVLLPVFCCLCLLAGSSWLSHFVCVLPASGLSVWALLVTASSSGKAICMSEYIGFFMKLGFAFIFLGQTDTKQKPGCFVITKTCTNLTTEILCSFVQCSFEKQKLTFSLFETTARTNLIIIYPCCLISADESTYVTSDRLQ